MNEASIANYPANSNKRTNSHSTAPKQTSLAEAVRSALLSDDQLRQLTSRLNLSERACEAIRAVRNSCPQRKVGVDGLLNMPGRMASQKAGHTIQTESRTVEGLFLLRQELDEAVLEVWDQPLRLRIERVRMGRRRHVSAYCPDFLVIRKDSIRLIECKAREAVDELLSNESDDWVCDAGKVRWLSGERGAAELGLALDVWIAERGWSTELANRELEVSLMLGGPPPNAQRLLTLAKRKVARRPRTIASLCAEVPNLLPGAVGYFVSTGSLFIARRAQLLTRTEDTVVYPSLEISLEADRAAMEARTKKDNALQHLTLSPLMVASEKEFSAALKRQSLFEQSYAAGLPLTRHQRRERARLEEVRLQNRPEIEAFLPNHAARGNRICRLSDNQIACYNDAIKELIKEKQRLRPCVVHARTVTLCEAASIPEISRETVRLRLKSESAERAALRESGKRGFHSVRDPIDPDDRALPATAAALVVHIDATQWDQKLWSASPVSEVLPCPYWYGVYDQYSEKCLGLSLALGKQDRFALALAIRDAWRRCGVFGNWVITDRGSEFESTFFQQLLARASVHHMQRPSGAPRFGSTVENNMGASAKQLAARLSGATITDKCGRSVDGNKKAARNVRYALTQAMQALEWFEFEHRNNQRRGTRDGTPNELFEDSRAAHPTLGIPLPSESDLLLLTSVPIESGDIVVDRRKGIRTHYRTYSSSELMAGLQRHGTPDEIRLDPEFPSLLRVRFKQNWCCARSNTYTLDQLLPDSIQKLTLLETRVLNSCNRKLREKGAKRLDRRIQEMEATAAHRRSRSELGPKRMKVRESARVGQRPAQSDLFDELEWRK